MEFVSLAAISFSVVMVLSGALASLFGNGKARGLGVLMCIIGVGLASALFYLCIYSDVEMFADVDLLNVLLEGIINFLAVIFGLLVAIGVFLVVVLKS